MYTCTTAAATAVPTNATLMEVTLMEQISTFLNTPAAATAVTLGGIFLLRVINVSGAVLRVMFLVRSKKWLAGAVGFFESLTWLFAAVAVLNSLDTPLKALAFSGGFAAGTVVGSWLEERLAVGDAVLRIFIREGNPTPVHMLRDKGWGVTEVQGTGRDGPVTILFTVIPRKQVKAAMQIVREQYPKAYVTVESISTIDPMHRKYQKNRG